MALVNSSALLVAVFTAPPAFAREIRTALSPAVAPRLRVEGDPGYRDGPCTRLQGGVPYGKVHRHEMGISESAIPDLSRG